MGITEAICKKCSAEYSFKKRKDAICPACEHPHEKYKKPESKAYIAGYVLFLLSLLVNLALLYIIKIMNEQIIILTQ
jgi:predicted amidophosphoribosyltransferase